MRTKRGVITKILCTATILQEAKIYGDEQDNEAWAVEFEDGTRAIVTTMCGKYYCIPSRAKVNELLRKTQESANSLYYLLSLVSEDNPDDDLCDCYP